MTNISTFTQVHRANTDRLQQYQATRRKGSVRLERAIMDEFDERGDVQLLSNNPDARIRFATTCTRHLRRFLGRADDVEFLWVTLAPGQYALPLEQAARFDPRKIIGWTHQAMRGFNYVGVVEASFYGNFGIDRRKKIVSWHVHLVVWDANARALRKVISRINQTAPWLIAGIEPAFSTPVQVHEVLGKTLYMLKSPRSEHRIYPKRVEVIDPDTGEITKLSTGRFRQKKRDLRTGDLARMTKIMAGRKIDHLAFGGGAGVAMLRNIRAEARQPLLDEEKRTARVRKLAKVGSPRRPRPRPPTNKPHGPRRARSRAHKPKLGPGPRRP